MYPRNQWMIECSVNSISQAIYLAFGHIARCTIRVLIGGTMLNRVTLLNSVENVENTDRKSVV